MRRASCTEKCSVRGAICNMASSCVTETAFSMWAPTLGFLIIFFHRERLGISACMRFEPSPAACKCLKANIELHGVDARVFECGLSSSSGVAQFTFYPANSVRSGFHADLEADRATTRTYMLNTGFAPKHADLFLNYKFKQVTFPCPLRTLSEVIDEERVTQIDLLKVDVEKSERDVLARNRGRHWGLIRQVVVEVDDCAGSLAQIQSLRGNRGFQVDTEQDPLLKGTAVYDVFASRCQQLVPMLPSLRRVTMTGYFRNNRAQNCLDAVNSKALHCPRAPLLSMNATLNCPPAQDG